MDVDIPSRIDPCLPEKLNPDVVDVIASLSTAAQRLGARLHPATSRSLADIVRVMNCYYSNLIEGHNTRLTDIEAALHDQHDEQKEIRSLQIEAVAHINVQKEIDHLYSKGVLPEPASGNFLRFIHKRFYAYLPEDMRRLEAAGTGVLFVQPGCYRTDAREQVVVGRHQPPVSSSVSGFMEYFESRYALSHLGKGMQLAALAAAHHRFNYIHPFLDGNGRVSRLMSHAMALQAGIGAHGLWSVSRGLARGVGDRGEYKRMMDHADMPRQGDLDGRGNLSLHALEDFIAWFLNVCLDQVLFMEHLFELDTLRERLKRLCADQAWGEESFRLIDALLVRGEIPRGECPVIMGMKERSARKNLRSLTDFGILGSDTPKGPVSLRFPPRTVPLLFPLL